MIDEIATKSLLFLRMVLNPEQQESIVFSAEEYKDIFIELQNQTVLELSTSTLSKFSNIPEELLSQWKKSIIAHFYHYTQYINIQKHIEKIFNDNEIPFVFIKGTSAACYYPHPEFRTMGDIDIITKREDINKACSVLENMGFSRLQLSNDFGRTIKFVKNNFEVEIHKYYASLNDPEKAEYLDNLILENINIESSKLPDKINGLVLLEHISDHLEHGLGLRQIIDWMMYVRNCLDDNKWGSWFCLQAERIGLKKLAIVVTKMCQIYLGLEETIQWCQSADVNACEELISYIMASGNFGIKEAANVQKRETIEAMANNHGLFQMLHLLQKYGENNWELLKKYRFLKPFAWIYQIGRSIKKRISNHTNAGEIIAEYRESKARKALFDELGVKQYRKGLAVLKGDHFEMQK